MGGRGASSGMSERTKNGGKGGNPYGTQYHTLLQDGNIKFVKKNSRQTSEDLMETMTSGRVYVTVGGEEIMRITYFDNENKRVKQIDLDEPHKGMFPHTHHGYNHNENDGPKGATRLTTEEKRMVDRVIKIWQDRDKKKTEKEKITASSGVSRGAHSYG